MAAPAPIPPVLQQVMVSLERETGLSMSFDDLTGWVCGMHNDVEALRLDDLHQIHSCSFCLFAKKGEGHIDCVRNKVAVNRLVTRRRAGLHGFCHLGLLDIAEPLLFQGRILGVFFYGSVGVKGREKLTRARVARYCAIRGFKPEPYYKALEKIPWIEEKSIPRHREALRAVVDLAVHLCKTGGIRADLYKAKPLKLPYMDPQEVPYIVKETMQYARAHLDEPFIVKDLAAHLRCHPDFLSRKFKQHTGVELSAYLQQIRVDRAKELLRNPKISIEDAAAQAGFSDRVHFSKVFRRVTRQTPGEYKKQFERPAVDPATLAEPTYLPGWRKRTGAKTGARSTPLPASPIRKRHT